MSELSAQCNKLRATTDEIGAEMTATDELDGKDVCRWGQFGDDMEMDVSTDCGHAMFEYNGDKMYWILDDGDKCPFCGKPIMRVWGWLF